MEGACTLNMADPSAVDNLLSQVSENYLSNHILSCQLSAYNDLIENKLPSVVAEFYLSDKGQPRDGQRGVPIRDCKKGTVWTLEFSNLEYDTPKYKNVTSTSIDGKLDDLAPTMAMNRGIDYSADMFLDLVLKNPSGRVERKKRVAIGLIPVLVKSRLCNLFGLSDADMYRLGEDPIHPGGYLIMGGSPKVIVMQERMAINQIYLYTRKKSGPKSLYGAQPEQTDTVVEEDEPKPKPDGKLFSYAEIRTPLQGKPVASSLVQVGFTLDTTKGLMCIVPNVKDHLIPLAVLLKALGATELEPLLVQPDNVQDADYLAHVAATVLPYKSMSQLDALDYIRCRIKVWDNEAGPYKQDQRELRALLRGCWKQLPEKSPLLSNKPPNVCKLLLRDLFTHMSARPDSNGEPDIAELIVRKTALLCIMARRSILFALGRLPLHDRDSYLNKRIHTVSSLFLLQFYSCFKGLCSKIQEFGENELKNGREISLDVLVNSRLSRPHKDSPITIGFRKALNKNTWSGELNKLSKNSAICQQLEIFHLVGSVGQCRKMYTPIGSEVAVVVAPRDLHGSAWAGSCCVVAGTLVKCIGGDLVPIEDVACKVVETVSPTDLTTEPSRVQAMQIIPDADTLVIKDDTGRRIQCTSDHPFLAARGDSFEWVQAGDLQVGEFVVVDSTDKDIVERTLSNSKSLSLLSSIEQAGRCTVYDITVASTNHSFVANGFVVHNCAESPESKKAGLIKALAKLATISNGTDNANARAVMLDLLQSMPSPSSPPPPPIAVVDVLIDGEWLGQTRQPLTLLQQLRARRTTGELGWETSIVYNPMLSEIACITDQGRLLRPCVVVRDGHVDLPADMAEMDTVSLLRSGLIELVSKQEDEGLLIATQYSKLHSNPHIPYTHVELDPLCIWGLNANMIVCANRNPAPRTTYGSNMFRQGTGVPCLNYRQLTSKQCKVMWYPQRPLCTTRTMHTTGYTEVPSGVNCLVMIAPLDGDNQEDSLVLNKGSVDRGMFCIDKRMPFEHELDKGECWGCASPKALSRSPGIYSTLANSHTVSRGMRVCNGQALIGWWSMGAKDREYYYIYYDFELDGVVDVVESFVAESGYQVIRVVVTSKMELLEGDKIAHSSSQKGIVSCIKPEEDVPFTPSGIRPDIVINPLAFPSRMTIGYLAEMLTGKANCVGTDLPIGELFKKDCLGRPYSDLTPFHDRFSLETVGKVLRDCGCSFMGDEMAISGITGKRIPCLIYTGLVYYHRLKHMIVEKKHLCGRTDRLATTGGPKEGKKAKGSLRTGVQEKDCMAANGCASLIMDRLIEQSDAYQMWVCNICGLAASVNQQETVKWCRVCDNNKVSKISIPYGSKLLHQELFALGVAPRIVVEPRGGEVKVLEFGSMNKEKK